MNSDYLQNNLWDDLFLNEERLLLAELGEKPDERDISSQDNLNLATLPANSETNFVPSLLPDNPQASVIAREDSTIRINTEFNNNSVLIAEIPQANTVGNKITLRVNLTGDQNDGSSNNGLSLRDAVIIANNNHLQHYEILLQSGQIYNLEIEGSGEFNSLTGDINIVGNGTEGSNITFKTEGGAAKATISAESLGDRAFTITNGSIVNFENIIVTGGSVASSDGKGGNYRIADGSKVTFENSIVERGFATFGGNFNITDSDVIFNDSISRLGNAQNGGAFFIEINSTSDRARLVLNNSQVIDNQASIGGAIFNKGATVEINNSTIADNVGRSTSGAIESRGLFLKPDNTPNNGAAKLIANNSIFENNQALRGNGGAIKSQQSTDVVIINSTFNNNSASDTSNGGAIWAGNNSTLNIAGSTFINNETRNTRGAETGNGGAIFANLIPVEITGSTFEGNNSAGSGGGIFAFTKEDPISIENSSYREYRG